MDKASLYQVQQTMFARIREANDAADLAKTWERRLEDAKAEAVAAGLDPEKLLAEAHAEWLNRWKV